jgi:error-prone DNA polymerase
VGFAHLHVRSGYSWGFGTATPEELVEEGAEAGMISLALTDRDGLYGVPRFLKAAEEFGISPIVGAEISMEAGGHVVLLVEDEEGYRNLSKLITSYRCSSEDRRKPLCSLSTLLEHSGGLVCLTGAVPFGMILRLVLSGNDERASEILNLLREGFGNSLYVELTDDQTAGSRRRMGRIDAFAKERGIPVVATNEIAYLRAEDHRLHEVMVASSNLSRLPGPEYRRTDQLYLRSSKSMEKLFKNYPEGLRTVGVVSERCAGSVRHSGEVFMPSVRLSGGETAEKKLLSLAVKGAKKRYKNSPFTSSEIKARLRREISCISSLGFAPYFLIAREAVEIAKNRGVPVTGRGSAANSLVSYCLGITQPEPLSNRLLFERFLHEERRDPPDIDLDFCSEGRDEVREEMIRRYEHLGVAEAATAQTLSLRGAVRVAARALGHAPQEINDLSRGVPTRFKDRGEAYTSVSGWEHALSEPAMRGHPLQDRKRYELLLALSWRLSGKLHQTGTHNGGMVFGTEDSHLSEIVPMEPSGMEGLLRVQADKEDLELLGLPKLDLLGLKTHTALKKAGELVSKKLGRRINPLSPPPDDKETYRLIRTGRNIGMFQVESPGQMNLSQRLKPRRFSDLVAQISLFRPGPVRGDLVTPYVMRRNGKEAYSSPLEEVEEILRETYQVVCYQEQVLEIARAVAGFSLTEGDLLRRAMTKARGPGAMDEIKKEFVKRAKERGVPDKKASMIFGWIEGFSVYGFPKAHAASFASVAYASAYMRTHHPAEFFSGVLNSQPMGFFSPRTVLNEARRVGVGILPPDIHLSERDFVPNKYGSALRVGLGYCKGLSEKSISSILSERAKEPFRSVADLYQRTSVERDSLVRLIEGGFLDDLANGRGDRNYLLAETRRLPKKRRKDHQPEIPIHPSSWWFSREKRSVEYLSLTSTEEERMEWDVLSLNVRRHPLSPYRNALRDLGVISTEKIQKLPHKTKARAAGFLECLQRPPTKSGAVVHFLVVEDEYGLLQATIFEDVYRRCGHVLHRSGAFLLEGRVEHDTRRGFSFLVECIRDLEKILSETSATSPQAVSGSGAVVRARGKSRRAG